MRANCSLFLRVAALLSLAGCGTNRDAPTPGPREYLYAWTASADSTQPDFLAVIDVTEEDSSQYGRLVTTLPVPGLGNGPHHVEHEMPADGQLFANGFSSGRSWVFNLGDAEHPAIAGSFGDIEGYGHPHSFLRLPNGNVLATFQMKHEGSRVTPGGLVELTPAAAVVRSQSADFEGLNPGTRVYSGGIVPALDRLVTTTTDMNGDSPASAQLQVWRLSDLRLLHTITLPQGPLGDEGMLTAEPRLLADGKRLLVSTFNCGLYLLDGVETEQPSARLVSSFPRRTGEYCAIPSIVGHYYLVTVPAWSAVVSLDISDPASPKEVSRVTLRPEDVPHWISVSPERRRVVITGYAGMEDRIVIARFDSTTGTLTLDDRFRGPGDSLPGFSMSGRTWPHGGNARGLPHGAVFSRSPRPSRPQ